MAEEGVGIDRELVDMLEKSKGMLGEAYPIIVDYDGEVLSGVHRKKAGWAKEQRIDTRELAKKWGVTPKMAKLIVKVHMNIQRKPSREETQAMIWFMAAELAKAGVPQEQVASELTRYVPYSRDYIWKLLPETYKKHEKVEAGKKAAEALKHKKEQKFGGLIPAEVQEPRKEHIPSLSEVPETLPEKPLEPAVETVVPTAEMEAGTAICRICSAKLRLIHQPSGDHRVEKILQG